MTATFLWLYKNHTEKTPLVKHEIKKTKAEFSITTIRKGCKIKICCMELSVSKQNMTFRKTRGSQEPVSFTWL